MPNFSDGPIAAIDRKKAATYALLKHWSGEMVSSAKTNAPWNDRTGNARQGIHGDVDKKGDGEFELYLAHSKEYGQILEEGSGIYGPEKKPFEIKPKNKKALFWPGAAHPIKSVTHPGMKPKAIIVPTLENHISKIQDSLDELWDRK